MRQFKQQIISQNRSYKSFNPIGVVLHETATPGATAQAEYNYFNSGKRGASAHGFIDWFEDIQTLPWIEKGWHAKEPANGKFIGIEMCRPKDNDPRKKDKMITTYAASVDAVARLFYWVLKIDQVTKDNLMSHDEVRIKWGNTTHTDPTLYLKELGINMNNFRVDVQKRLEEIKND